MHEGVNESSGRIACHGSITSLPEEIDVNELGNRNSRDVCEIKKQKHRGIRGNVLQAL